MTATGLPPSLGMTALAKICNLFRIDTRSLGFLRIGLATLVLWDLILHAQYLRAHLTDFGVLPTWSTSWLINYQPGHWSLHLASGTWQWQLALLMLQGMAAVALLVGYRTRWANLAPALLDTDPPSTAVKWWRSFNADAAFLEYFSAAWCPLVNRQLSFTSRILPTTDIFSSNRSHHASDVLHVLGKWFH